MCSFSFNQPDRQVSRSSVVRLDKHKHTLELLNLSGCRSEASELPVCTRKTNETVRAKLD